MEFTCHECGFSGHAKLRRNLPVAKGTFATILPFLYLEPEYDHFCPTCGARVGLDVRGHQSFWIALTITVLVAGGYLYFQPFAVNIRLLGVGLAFLMSFLYLALYFLSFRTAVRRMSERWRCHVAFDPMKATDADLKRLDERVGVTEVVFVLQNPDAWPVYRSGGRPELSPKVTTLGLRHIEAQRQLEVLWLDYLDITDEQLVICEHLPKLRCLSLAGTLITDIGLCHLENLKALEELDVSNTKVTQSGIQRLRQWCPTLTVHYFDHRPAG